MGLVQITSECFPTELDSAKSGNVPIQPQGEISVTLEDILHAALTLGIKTPPTTTLPLPWSSPDWKDIIGDIHAKIGLNRVQSIKTILTETPSGRFGKNTDFEDLVSEEKAPITNKLGSVMGKVVFEYYYGPCVVLFLEPFLKAGKLDLKRGEKRPDLFAKLEEKHSPRCFVIECKGRSSGFSSGALQRGLDQATNVSSIDNDVPSGCIATLSYFHGKGSSSELKFSWKDPDPKTYEGFEYILPREYHYFHYAACLSICNAMATPKSTDSEFLRQINTRLAESMRDLDCEIELHPRVKERLDVGDWRGAFNFCRSSPEVLSRTLDKGFFPDGIRISLGPTWRKSPESPSPDGTNGGHGTGAARQGVGQESSGVQAARVQRIVAEIERAIFRAPGKQRPIWFQLVRDPAFIRWIKGRDFNVLHVADTVDAATAREVIQCLRESVGVDEASSSQKLASYRNVFRAQTEGRFLAFFEKKRLEEWAMA